jgi:hypothetical protein
MAYPNHKLFHSAYSIAEAIGISYPMVFHHLWDSFGMKDFHLRQTSHAGFIFHNAQKSFQMIITFPVFRNRLIYYISHV